MCVCESIRAFNFYFNSQEGLFSFSMQNELFYIIVWTAPLPIKRVSGLFVRIVTHITAIPVLYANSVDPDRTPCSATLDLGLHRLQSSYLWDARL